MKSNLPTRFMLAALLASAAVLLGPASSAGTPLSTVFTYQGRLAAGGSPANGDFDLRLTLYDANANGNLIGAPLFNSGVSVSNGFFTTTVDFGAGVFDGTTYWLEVAIRPSGAGTPFRTLTPRQRLAGTPYALFAANAALAATSANASNALTAVKALSAATADQAAEAAHAASANSVPWTGITGLPQGFLDGIDNDTTYTAGAGLTLSNGRFNVDFAGSGISTSVAHADHVHAAADITVGVLADARIDPSITRDSEVFPLVLASDGAGSGLDADKLDGLESTDFWRLTGNAGAIPGLHFLGTTDGSDLDLRVKSVTGLRLRAGSGARPPNVIGGSSLNSLGVGVSGAAIGGGNANSALTDYAVIGGGSSNAIGSSASFATVGGGTRNLVSGSADFATIGGGGQNVIGTNANLATIPGGGGGSARNYGQLAYASGMFVTPGDAQSAVYVLRNTTTNATPASLFLDGLSESMHVPLNGRWLAHIQVVAAGLPGSNLSAGFTADVVVKNLTGTAALVGGQPVSLQAVAQEGAACFVTVTTAGDALVLRVTGPSLPQVVRWVATVRTTELTF